MQDFKIKWVPSTNSLIWNHSYDFRPKFMNKLWINTPMRVNQITWITSDFKINVIKKLIPDLHMLFLKKKSSLAVVKIKPGKNRLYLYYCLSTGTGVVITLIVTYQSYLCSALTMWDPNLLFISFSAFKFLVTRKSGEKSG